MLALAITVCFAEDSSEETQDHLICTSNYLKAKGLLDSQFRVKSSQSDVPEAACTEFVSSFKDAFYENINKEFKTDKDLADIAGCLMGKAREVELADLALKVVAYEGAFSMPKRKRKKAVKAIELAIQKKTETMVKVCASSRTFGDVYDQICKKDSSESDEDSPVDDYCIRKYFTENNFINTTIHQIDLNPKKVDVTGADCEKVVAAAKTEAMAELKKEFEEDDEFVSRHAKKCLLKSINDSKYFEAAGKAVILCEVTMTPEIKEFERNQFIKDMEFLYEIIYRC